MKTVDGETQVQSSILLFGKYDMTDIAIRDGGLAKYIDLSPITVPHTGGKHANKSFAKSKMSIVERLVNNLMRTEVYTGKKVKSIKIVKGAFEIIERKTGNNPLQVLVEAIENAAPREEITRLQFGGISVPKAVDISPSRRLDIALRNIARGSVDAAFKSKKSAEDCLADELILASKGDMTSFAVAKKEELERVAASAR
ncbi:30S ribosomal protein S7 [Candidatus Methanomassiliicoccus intestinalis]|uniref:30S ribosomal protein S7 n=1 Tax=Candidatus Methanomassiliicoccus intestinalis TaxID=1406512 RepID=UPI0037DCB156